MGTLPYIYHKYITPTLLFYFEIAKLGYVNHLNVKEVNEILSNNRCYYKEVFDMYNYLMIVMKAIEQKRDFDHRVVSKNKTPEALAQELFDDIMGDHKGRSMDNTSILSDKKGIVTIEVTPEDTKRMQQEKETRLKSFSQEKIQRDKERSNRLRKQSSSTSK